MADNTIDQIVTSSEAVFAEKGYDGASLREITKSARTNLASINYHFENKQKLYCAVIIRGLRPINEVRLKNLSQAENIAGEQPVPLGLIFDILVRPLFQLGAATNGKTNLLRIIGRSMIEPHPFMDELFREEFQPVITSFGRALRRHTPHLSPEDFVWHLNFIMGALHHTLATLHHMKERTQGICLNDDYEGALHRFVHFAVGAITAPVPA